MLGRLIRSRTKGRRHPGNRNSDPEHLKLWALFASADSFPSTRKKRLINYGRVGQRTVLLKNYWLILPLFALEVKYTFSE